MTFSFINAFAASESGAVSVDWVVLTAGVVGLGFAVIIVVSGGFEDLSGDVATDLTNVNPLVDPFDDANQRVAGGT
ncbi:hypothetical protein V8J82_04160 [Gymnodinialimonas sp. 2305UL16-5]|uniref:hypothetical protein n=1 Tax=Gymnodinialimonas mytili TaxID=3126503 RepID=UPI0030A3E138